MKASTLARAWAELDNTRLTAKQQTFRFPTHVAAKVDALCDLFPQSTRTKVVGDLVTSALNEVIENLAEASRAEFQKLANKHYKKYEKELGTKTVAGLYAPRGNTARRERS